MKTKTTFMSRKKRYGALPTGKKLRPQRFYLKARACEYTGFYCPSPMYKEKSNTVRIVDRPLPRDPNTGEVISPLRGEK